MSNSTSSKASFTALGGNPLTFELTVTDKEGLYSKDTVTIHFDGTTPNGNHPIADAGSDKTVYGGNTVILDGSNSSDPDDGIASYLWTQKNAPWPINTTPVTILNAGSAKASFIAPDTSETLTFILTVTDFSGLSSSDTASIEVKPNDGTKNPPIADAGQNHTVTGGETVTLNGSNSSDPDDGIASYKWVQKGGKTVTLSNANSVQTTFIAPEAETTDLILSFELTVTDKGGLSSSNTVNITIEASSVGKPPVADAGSDKIVKSGDTVELDGSKSLDPDGSIFSYKWEQTSGIEVALTGYNKANPTFTAPTIQTPSETLVFELTVTDNDGLTGKSNVTIIVSAGGNIPPIADAGPNQKVSRGATVTLNALNSSDPDGSIVSIKWEQTSGTSVSLSEDSSSATFIVPSTGASAEKLTFQLTVTDNQGLSTTDSIDIIISEGGQYPPFAVAGDDKPIFVGDKVYLDGSNSSDPDGEVVTYQWTQLDPPWPLPPSTKVSISNANSAKASFTAPTPKGDVESFTFQLTITDDDGNPSTDTIVIKVVSNNSKPVANAGNDITVDVGAKVVLDGTASSDPEGATLIYDWTQTGGVFVLLSGADTSQAFFTAPDIGTSTSTILSFKLQVKDDIGFISEDTTVVKIEKNNAAPIAEAGDNQSVSAGEQVFLDGSKSNDPDGNSIKYKWTQIGGQEVVLFNSGTATPLFYAPNLGQTGGTLTFQLTVTDSWGVGSKDTVMVNIVWLNTAPIANAGEHQVVTEGEIVTLDASKSNDLEGNITSYTWVQTSGTAVLMADPTSAVTTFTAPSVGVDGVMLIFKVIVTDSGGLKDSKEVTVIVEDNGAQDNGSEDNGSQDNPIEPDKKGGGGGCFIGILSSSY
ncbi:MAG: hypothetical protein HQK76_10820 [Desulfobacterales bacterium]|nr:hypothetical protein [Desulfobacterales bacterium]